MHRNISIADETSNDTLRFCRAFSLARLLQSVAMLAVAWIPGACGHAVFESLFHSVLQQNSPLRALASTHRDRLGKTLPRRGRAVFATLLFMEDCDSGTTSSGNASNHMNGRRKHTPEQSIVLREHTSGLDFELSWARNPILRADSAIKRSE